MSTPARSRATRERSPPWLARVQRARVFDLRGPETEVRDVHPRGGGPVDGLDQIADPRPECAVEHLHHVQLGVRRLFFDRRGHRGAVAEAIDVVVVLPAVFIESDTSGNRPNVRMPDM